MSRGTKYFLTAIAGAIVAWMIGTMLVGMADVRHFTASGTVDPLDSIAVARALADPTYTASLTWGSFTLTGMHWLFSLPLIMAAIAFAFVLLIARVRRHRGAP